MFCLRTWKVVAALGAVAVMGAAAEAVQSMSGAGATFPYPIYSKWADAYAAKTGIHLNYQAIGSGGGIKQIESRTMDFGASDAPLEPQELEKNALVQFPTVMGGVVPVYNLKEVESGDLKLTGDLLADIYLGNVKKWNDPKVAALNPGVSLPDRAITVVHRADGSGTTWIFTQYLNEVSPDWKQRVGSDTAVSWPTGIGGKGNQGVASYVQRIPGALGYVEYAYAVQNAIPHAQMKNASGSYVQPTDATFQAAAANADWAHARNFHVVLTNQPGAESWPITGATFILMPRQPKSPETARAVLDFFRWAYANGDSTAAELHYVPLPKSVKELVQAMWSRDIQGAGQGMASGGASAQGTGSQDQGAGGGGGSTGH